jgi:DNA-binding transcriptional LysR family regulator
MCQYRNTEFHKLEERMDRLDELAIFVAIVEAGSLAGAARRLRRSPPAVTRALHTLEARSGERLVERTTRRLATTAAGYRLAEHARTLLADYEGALAGGHNERSVGGLLRLTAPVQFGRRYVAPLVASFLDAYPAVRVELVLNDRNLDLIEEGLDMALRIGPLADSSLVARKVGAVRRVVVASPDYLARHGLPRTPADLAQHDAIFGMARAPTREWRFGRAPRGTAVRLLPRLLVDDVDTQIQAAEAGRGIVRLLSYQVADGLAAGTLVRLLAEYEPGPLAVHLVTLGRAPALSKVRAFLDHAAEPLADTLARHDTAIARLGAR